MIRFNPDRFADISCKYFDIQLDPSYVVKTTYRKYVPETFLNRGSGCEFIVFRRKACRESNQAHCIANFQHLVKPNGIVPGLSKEHRSGLQ